MQDTICFALLAFHAWLTTRNRMLEKSVTKWKFWNFVDCHKDLGIYTWYIPFCWFYIDGRLFDELNVRRWTVNIDSKDVCWDMSAVDVVVKAKLFIHIHFHWIYLKCGCGFVMLPCQCRIDSPSVCFSEQITTSNLYRHSSRTNLRKHTFVASFIFQFGEFDFFGWTLKLKLYIIWQIKCSAIIDILRILISIFINYWLFWHTVEA